MIALNFEIALRSFARRRPFKPFFVELVSGDLFQVRHPEAIRLRGGVAVFIDPQRNHKLFDSHTVCQLCDAPPETAV